MFRNEPGCTKDIVSAISNRIRPMNLGGMCFDCRMIYDIVFPLLHLIGNDMANVPERTDLDWAKSFATTTTTDLNEYRNPI